jgi:hypothetical protein
MKAEENKLFFNILFAVFVVLHRRMQCYSQCKPFFLLSVTETMPTTALVLVLLSTLTAWNILGSVL